MYKSAGPSAAMVQHTGREHPKPSSSMYLSFLSFPQGRTRVLRGPGVPQHLPNAAAAIASGVVSNGLYSTP